jgi:uncharacterized UBP type Zn finger protein
MERQVCSDLEKLADPARAAVKPSGTGCKECLEAGDEWVHLRLCMTCGHLGCCDSSPNRHASKHFHRTKHPTIKAYEPGEDWAYCYVDDLVLDGLQFLPGESTSRHYSAAPAQHP